MAENDESQEKTEEPSQRRLDKAREDGQILNSKDMFVATTMATGTLILFAAGSQLPGYIQHWQMFFTFDSGAQLADLFLPRAVHALSIFVIISLVIGLPMMAVVLATQMAVGGAISFSGKALAFKGSRISPLAGLKRMFSVKGLVELGKAVLKVVALGSAAGTVVYAGLPAILSQATAPLARAKGLLADQFFLLMVAALLVLGAIAAIDYAWARHTHMKELRMSRQDLKDESKDTNGSPEVKSRIRRLQYEASARAAQQAEALGAVKDATAIITNPTHFAVALKYAPGEAGAPIILAMGRGAMAQRIKERAKEFNITQMESPLLARALYYTGGVGQEIAEGLYSAVAAVLAYIYRIERGEWVDEPQIDLPDALQFDENGAALHGA
jgi:flagellar biosynthetic protein FlhB